MRKEARTIDGRKTPLIQYGPGKENKSRELAGVRMIIVAKDGSGHYSSIQAAVDAADGESARILVRPGVYREKVVIWRDNVTLTGEDREATMLVWNGCAKDRYEDGTEKGTFLSSTLMVTGRNVTVENMTVCNDAGD